jgi:hypothetical protein
MRVINIAGNELLAKSASIAQETASQKENPAVPK